MTAVVEVSRLTKSYRDVTAVDDVSFAIEAGKIYGLLGRNGAGKTTLMQMITAQAFPTIGELRVFGESPFENNRVLSRICFIKESQKYPDNYRVADVLDLCSDLFPNWDRDFADRLVEAFRLPPKRQMRKLSRGMLSSVGIVAGLASRAPLTIFDEPYLGLDAASRSLFYELLVEDYAEHPRTVILSTHLIDEVSRILEHVIVINDGRVLIDEETDSLRNRAFTVSGATADVEAFAKGKTVLHRETLGGLASAIVVGNPGADDRQLARSLRLELDNVPLQQLIVHLTSRKSYGKEAKA
ncbi:ABC transporter ATP-binding protein [Paenibacillus cisolokensis]|uniref:ABC transporter ATP-binding protein n=1 Tax=Paenibacillus cisolokensis TaxID=1658519 RepID=A0ABQ4N3A4_9BACL|nr:ABC transporter ATP-binding protein [Paenibacillus cisolokensis]GIQ62644.1 ABC transporter ATP-binding protein [Paenibacillus cisolokensis]